MARRAITGFALVGLVVACVSWVLASPAPRGASFEQQARATLRDHRATLDLAAHVGGSWDRLVVLPAYATADEAYAAMGFDDPQVDGRLAAQDGRALLVGLRGPDVVSVVSPPIDAECLAGRTLPRGAATVSITERAGLVALQPRGSTCADAGRGLLARVAAQL